MTVWGITIVLGLIVLLIVFKSFKDGRKTKDFLETITPEINQLKDRQIEKYKAKFGRDPTGPFALVDEPPSKPHRRHWFRK